MRSSAVVVLHLLGGYLVLRALVEPFVIDVTDPATYDRDWGGPSLAGVLAVHCLPGLVALVLAVRHPLRAASRPAATWSPANLASSIGYRRSTSCAR